MGGVLQPRGGIVRLPDELHFGQRFHDGPVVGGERAQMAMAFEPGDIVVRVVVFGEAEFVVASAESTVSSFAEGEGFVEFGLDVGGDWSVGRCWSPGWGLLGSTECRMSRLD